MAKQNRGTSAIRPRRNGTPRASLFRVLAFSLLPFLSVSGCQRPNATGTLPQPQVPPGVDVRKLHLTLDQIPDDPKAPVAADLSTRPAIPQPALRRLTDAQALFADQRYAEAALELERALRYDQKQYEVQRLLCLACYLSGSEAKARLRAGETVRLNPQDEAAWFVLGRAAFKSGERDEALRCFRTALKCPPNPSEPEYRALVHLHLGLLLDDMGYARAAVDQFAAFDKAFARLSEKQRAHPELAAFEKAGRRALALRRGRALARLGDYKAAALVLAAPAAEAPADAALQAEYAEILVRAGRARDAIETVRAHVRRQAASKPSVELLMSVRRWAGEANRIPDDLQGLVEAYPDRIDLALLLAHELMNAGRLDAAAVVLRSVQQRHPAEEEPAWLLADILRRQQRWSDWIVAMADLVAARQEQYVKVQQSVEDLAIPAAAARAVLTRTAESAAGKPNEWAVLYVVGVIAGKVGDEAAAERFLRRSVELEPARIPAAMALGDVLARQFRWQDVIAVGEASIRAGAKAASLEWLVGYGYDGLDDWDQALKHYQAARDLNPKDRQTLRSLAMLYERMNDARKSQAAWRDLLTVDSRNAEARERLLRGYVARDEAAAAASQLVELKDQQGASSPVYRRCEALLRMLRTRNEGGMREYREQLGEIVKSDPADVRTREEYAGLLFNAGKYREAAEQADEILKRNQDSSAAWELRALLAVRALRYEEAEAAFGELLRRYPNREAWHRGLAEVYLIQLKYDSAANELRKLAGLPSARERRSAYRANLLGVYQAAGRIDEMTRLAEQWLADAPDDASTRLLVLAADEAAKNYARMAERCRAWLRDDRQNRRQWRKRLVDALNGLKRYAESEALVTEWLAEDPNDGPTIGWLAEVLAASGRHRDAIEWLRSAVVADPSQSLAYQSLLYRVQIEADDYDGAIASLRQIGAQNRNPVLEGEIARILIQAKRYGEAEDLLNKLIDRTEDDVARAGFLRTLAFCYQKQKRFDLAEQRMLEALKLAPNDVGINNDLGYTWADAGRNLDEAEKMLRYVVGESPREAAYLDSLGWVYYKKGDFRSALTWLSRAAAQSDGRDPLIYDHLADAYWRLGQKEDARRCWEQAIQIAAERAERGRDDQEAEAVAKAREKLAALSRGDAPGVARTAGEEPAAEKPSPHSTTDKPAAAGSAR